MGVEDGGKVDAGFQRDGLRGGLLKRGENEGDDLEMEEGWELTSPLRRGVGFN